MVERDPNANDEKDFFEYFEDNANPAVEDQSVEEMLDIPPQGPLARAWNTIYTSRVTPLVLVGVLGLSVFGGIKGCNYLNRKNQNTQTTASDKNTTADTVDTIYTPPTTPLVSTPPVSAPAPTLENTTQPSKNPYAKITCPDGRIVEIYSLDPKIKPQNACPNGSASVVEYSSGSNGQNAIVTLGNDSGLEGKINNQNGMPGVENQANQAEKIYASQPYVKRNIVCQTYGDKEVCPSLEYSLQEQTETVFSVTLSPDRKIAALLTSSGPTKTRAYVVELVTDSNGLITRAGDMRMLEEYTLGNQPRMKRIEWTDNSNLNIESIDTVRNGRFGLASEQKVVVQPCYVERI